MTIVEGVGWVLVHFVWQGAAIALALAVLLAIAGEAHARVRYALSCGALALMLLATLATAARVVTGGAGRSPAGASLHMEAATVPAPASGRDAGRISSTSESGTPLRARAGVLADWTPRARPVLDAAMPWLVGAWVIGVLVLSIRLLGGWWRTHTLRVAGVAPVPDWCLQQLAALSARMRITRPVSMVCSVRLSVPVIVGHLRPLIVLPAAALSGLRPHQLEAILAHELAHVRRHDYLVNLAQTLIETWLFYHPAVWWVSRQVRVSREHCCDDLAVTLSRSRHDYVHALLDLEELRGEAGWLALGATDGSLLARGRRLLAPVPGRASSARLAASVIGLTAIAAGIASATLDSAVVPPFAESPAPAALTAPAVAEARARPAGQTVGATPVVEAPDAAGSLDRRWAWAERAAQTARHPRYWIGYSVTPVRTLPAFVYLDRASKVFADGGGEFSGHLMSPNASGLRFPGRPLGLRTSVDAGIKLMFELETGRGAPSLAAVHGSTLSIAVDTKNLPVFWLGPADPAPSLDRIDRFYRAISDADLKHDLVAAAGVHDLSPSVVAWLERRIASQDSDDLRGDAAEWMAWHPIEASLRTLERIARSDRSTHVRQEAAEALGDLAMPEAAPVLIALARSLTDPDARREAVEALGARPEPAAAEALASIARLDADRDIQREAVETLGDFADRRGVPVLIELARTHPSVEVRREAIETLGEAMPADTVLPVLEKLLKDDSDPEVQAEAVDTIAGIDDPKGLAILMDLARSQSSSAIRREAVEAMADRASGRGQGTGTADQAAIVDLLARLAATDRDADVQAEAAQTLGEIGGAAAVAELRKLAESHADERIRAEAIESLGESGAPSAETAAFLKRLALADQSHRVQGEAMEILEGLPGDVGIAALIDLARDHPDAETRRQALETLIESEHPAARAVFDRAIGKK
jgi:HEAT repeat protein/beta-lactamase regulating signal transducer with metallopeptidase domain